MKGTLNLGGNIFEVRDCHETRLFIMESDEEEGTLTLSVDIWFNDGEYDGEDVGPSICINEHETGVSDISQMVGTVYSVDNIEEADEREDSFYLFEHEPMENYTLEITEIKDNEAHIVIKGTAVTDGYADPYQTSEFSIDCWLPIPEQK